MNNFVETSRSVLSFYEKYSPRIEYENQLSHHENPYISYSFSIIVCSIYLVLLATLPSIQKKHRFLIGTVYLKIISVTWNLILCLYSTVSCVYFTCWMVVKYVDKGYSVLNTLCPLSQEYYHHPHVFWVYLFIISKYFEMGDTLLLVIKKPERPVTFLHQYHHVSVALVTWIGFQALYPGIFFGAFMNNFIHMNMYFYYALTSFFKPSWGFIITVMQILQMFIGFIVSLTCAILLFTRGCSVHEITSGWITAVLMIVMYMTYIHLFIEFMFKRHYPSDKDKKEKKKLKKG